MSKILRKTLSIFGLTGTTDDFEEFGSTAVGATSYTKDIATIQGLAAWNTGWRAALVTAKAPVLQDQNAVQYVHSYMTAYLLQAGIAEYDAGTTYYTGSVVSYFGNAGYVEFYCSQVDTNVGNALGVRVTNAHWQFMYAINLAVGIIIPGRLTNTTPPAGAIGELVSAVVANVGAPTSGNIGDASNIPLTAGDWTISANARFETGGGTQTGYQLGISLTAGNNGTGLVNGDNDVAITLASGLATFPMAIVDWPLQLSGSQTVYLKFGATYSGAAPLMSGRITARRAS